MESSDNEPRGIAFISTRIAGHDGVSLEVEKWAHVLERMGHECYYIAGECDRPRTKSEVIPEAHFRHRAIDEINRHCFGRELRSHHIGALVREMERTLKERVEAALNRFGIDLIIAENCLTIPMNIPLGLALVETVMETGIGCIAHHHDFVWERERFLVNAADDYLSTAFPPSLPQMQHVVINSKAARDFSRRVGLPCRVVPNVMDFDQPPPTPDEYARRFKEALGLQPDDLIFLQPTRVVPRKGIEHSIELLHRLGDTRCKLVISHASGDEGDAYAKRIQEYAESLQVPLVCADDRIATSRGTAGNGRPSYTIADAYQNADFVTYPSTYEGFGNAFLEAVYYGLPVLCNRYAIYRTDIEPCGFRVVLMDGFLTDEVVKEVRQIVGDQELRTEIAKHNYEVARRFFSYQRVEDELRALIAKPKLAPPVEDGRV